MQKNNSEYLVCEWNVDLKQEKIQIVFKEILPVSMKVNKKSLAPEQHSIRKECEELKNEPAKNTGVCNSN